MRYTNPRLLYFTLLYATDLSLRAIKCCSVVFNVTLRLLVILVVVSRCQQTLSLTTSDKCHNLRDRGPVQSC